VIRVPKGKKTRSAATAICPYGQETPAYNRFGEGRTGGRRRMEWARMLADITGTIDEELLLRNE
jgi:hypothetical protein